MAENPLLNNRYHLIEQEGSGGMAVIYRAQDLELSRIVAVKVLRPSLVNDPEFLLRFKQEARAAANLSHPNIVTVFDVGQDGPRMHYIVMEYVPGQDLKKLIRAQAPFEVDAALAIVVEICKGVGYAHRAGLVHCDIKPQNILVTPDRRIKVTDFGIARALSATQTEDMEDVVWGSPHYFSPEQAAGEPPTPASDVYSIGIVLFELLTGQLPFTGSDYRELALAHLRQDPPSLVSVNPVLPGELDGIVRKVLSKEPSARYRTADQLGRILDKYRQRGLQPTGQFTVTPSQAPVRTRPSQQPVEAPRAEPTTPSLPPVDPAVVREQIAASRLPHRAYYPPPEEQYEEEPAAEGFLPGVDVFGIVLGVLAAVAVMGLIPLWIVVYLTFTR